MSQSTRANYFRSPTLVAGIALVGLFAGLGTLAVALWLAYQEQALPQAEGEVIRVDRIRGPHYAPTVQYDVDGQKYQLHGPKSPGSPAYRVGERVTVWYPPGRPAEGRLRAFFEVWGWALTLGSVGSLLAIAGVGLLLGLAGSWALASGSRRVKQYT